MATHAPITGAPSRAPHIPTVTSILARYDRASLEAFLSVAIDLLDTMDGDPDIEEDDPSGQCDEDGINTGTGNFAMHGTSFGGPGCPISDPGSSAFYKA